MPYEVRKVGSGPKPWKIIRKDTGETVGESDSKEKADRSVGYRISGEAKKKTGAGGNSDWRND